MYEKGVFSSKNCGTDIDHAIQLVGYGTADEIVGVTSDYWLVRNSWGAGWGEDGELPHPLLNRHCVLFSRDLFAPVTKCVFVICVVVESLSP